MYARTIPTSALYSAPSRHYRITTCLCVVYVPNDMTRAFVLRVSSLAPRAMTRWTSRGARRRLRAREH